MNPIGVNEAVGASEKLASQSHFDIVSILIIVIFLSLFGFMVVVQYKRQNKEIDGLHTKLDAIEDALKKALNDMHTNCSKRSDATKKVVDENVKYLEIAIDNLFNAITELMQKESPFLCDTKVALELFNMVMDLHCHKKTVKLYEKLRFAPNLSVDDISLQLGREYKEITLDEKEFFDKVYYSNNHTLGEELEFILKKENWENFVETNIKTLIEKHRRGETSFLEVKDDVMSSFDNLIEPMRLNIIKKGQRIIRRV